MRFFHIVFLATKPRMKIYVAFPFDFLGYQTQSLIIFLFLFKFISKKFKGNRCGVVDDKKKVENSMKFKELNLQANIRRARRSSLLADKMREEEIERKKKENTERKREKERQA